MKSFLISLLLILSLSSCASINETHPICENRADSYICQVFPNPLHADLVLRIANVEAIKNDLYTKEEALKAIRNIEVLVSQVSTFSDLYILVNNYISNMGPEIFIIAEALSNLNQQVIIPDFDRQLILEHLRRQRQVIQMIE